MDELDNIEEIRKVDSHDMLGFIGQFPEQIQEARGIAKGVKISNFRPRQVVIAGVGGSAIGGDILASWLFKRIDIPIFVNRAYKLPNFVDKDTLLFAVSYSGNTEETLSLFEEGLTRKCKIVAITSGGKLEELCKSSNVTLIKVPKGKPPRASVAYLFIPIVVVLKNLDTYNPDEEMKVVLDTLRTLRKNIVPESPTKDNLAKQLAKKLINEIPIIYGEGIFNSIARRWQTQFNENSKMLSWHSMFPEMNHNEIEAWAKDAHAKEFTVVILRDDFRLDSQLQKRVGLTRDTILKKHVKKVIEVVARGGEEKDYLARMLYTMYLGDYTSIYMAVLRGIDPSPVSAIEDFKRDLARV